MSQKQDAWYEMPMVKDLMGLFGGKAIRGIQSAFSSSTIYWGKSGVSTMASMVKAVIDKEDRRALIIVDSFTQKFVSKVAVDLDFCEIEYKVYSNIEPEVPYANVEGGVKLCEEFKPTVLIAIGGGSVMDAAKAIMIKYEKPEANFHMMLPIGDPLGLRKKIRYLVAIPTTSGTGSEVTSAAVLTDTNRTPHKKLTITNPEIVPDMAILDTDFVVDMPPSLTRGSGLDALGHSVGSYVSNWGNPIADAMNIAAIKETLKYLPRAYKYGKGDLEARAHMQLAAAIAGLGFSNTIPGIDHALGHSFGKVFGVHHGLAIGLFLPYSVAFQAKVTERWIDLCPVFGVKTEGKEKNELLIEFIAALNGFIHSIDGPACVKELNDPKITKEEYMEKLDLLADYANNDAVALTSYRPLNHGICKKIFEYAWEGKIINF
ncbi:MAG: iron-containing alcohol dehydrogenase [Promethearchaeota archaeon]|jgi:alcohol dehydrogenase class IV